MDPVESRLDVTDVRLTWASADQEEFLLAPGGDAEMFGIITRPPARPRRTGVLLVWGSGRFPSPGRNGVRTRLARRLAGHGYTTVRFDYPGVGESGGRYRAPDFARPQSDEVAALYRYLLGDDDVDEVVVVAYCFGGRNVVGAIEQLPNLRGLALLCTPFAAEDHAAKRQREVRPAEEIRRAARLRTIRHLLGPEGRRYRRIARSRTKAVAARILPKSRSHNAAETVVDWCTCFTELLQRGASLLLMSSTLNDFHRDFESLLRGPAGDVLRRHDDRVQIEVREGRLHGLAALDVQADVSDTVVDWICRVTGGASTP